MCPAATTSKELDPAVWWGEGDYELRERAYAPIHARVIERLDPRPGERVLDVACGLGAIAARAARIRRYENFRIDDTINIPQMYLLSVGHKRAPKRRLAA